jgi:uncharacterized membrane protein YdjX (TVP38/TMEM64 family)
MPALRLLLLVLVATAIAAAWLFAVPDQLSWTGLAARRAAMVEAATLHPAASVVSFIGVYALIVTLSVPATMVMSVTAGLLFGTVLGAAASVLGATLGSILLFLLVRHAFRPFLAGRTQRLIARIGPRLERDGFSYLLALRLIPALPFWLVNLAPALIGMRLLPYAAATLLGIIPASAVFASIGAGIGGALAQNATLDMGILFSPRILGPLAALAALSLLPVAWRRLRKGAHA